jgi:hypothetical protein
MIGLAMLILSVSLVLAGPYVTVIFEYTVGPDGSRRNLHVVRVEDPPTHQELKGALTKEELARGVGLVAQRKPPSAKQAGQKLYEINLFDMRTRQYIGK